MSFLLFLIGSGIFIGEIWSGYGQPAGIAAIGLSLMLFGHGLDLKRTSDESD